MNRNLVGSILQFRTLIMKGYTCNATIVGRVEKDDLTSKIIISITLAGNCFRYCCLRWIFITMALLQTRKRVHLTSQFWLTQISLGNFFPKSLALNTNVFKEEEILRNIRCLLSKNVVGIEFEPRTLTREKQFTEDVTSECCNEFAKAQILETLMIEKAFYLSREQTLSIIRGNPNLKKFYFIPRWIHHLCDWIDIFSSPDPLGQVSYCHHWASVVRPSINFVTI